jgi:hypothetical protein
VQTHPSKRCLPTNTPPTQHKKRKGSVHTQQKTPLMIYDTVSLTINVFIVFIQLFQIQQCTRGHPFQKITKKINKSVQPKSDNIGALLYLHWTMYRYWTIFFLSCTIADGPIVHLL